MITLGVGGYVLGAPAMHLLHERPGAAAGSFGLHVTLPLLGAVLASAQANCPRPATPDHTQCPEVGEIAWGVIGGMLAASMIDATALAWAPTKAEAPVAPRLGFAPVISNDGKRGELRVFGSF